MYTANSPKELKKLIKEDKFPIQVTDEETKEIVEILESLKSKGVLPTAKDEIKDEIKKLISIIPTTTKTISTTANDMNVVCSYKRASLATIIALYALYKKKNIDVRWGPLGPILTTRD